MMRNPVFDLTPPEELLVEWSACSLIIEVSSQYLYYALIDDRQSVVALRYYQLSVRSDAETMHALEEIWSEDALLQHPVKESVVLYHCSECCLVPEKYFNTEVNGELFELVHGDMDKSPLFSEKIRGWDIYNLYKVPEELHQFFQSRIPSCRYWHYYSLLLDCQSNNDETLSEDRVNIVFYPKQVVIAAIANGQVQLVRSFNYQAVDDVSWYLLDIYRQFNLKQAETPLYVGGMIEQKSALYGELLKYFLVVKPFTVPAGFTVTEQFQAFPEHFFSPLLKLVACVS